MVTGLGSSQFDRFTQLYLVLPVFLSTTQSTILFFPFFFFFVAPLPITEMALSSDNTSLCKSFEYDEMEFDLDSFARWLLALKAYDPVAQRRSFLAFLLSSLLDPRFPLWFSRTTHNRVFPISFPLDPASPIIEMASASHHTFSYNKTDTRIWKRLGQLRKVVTGLGSSQFK